MLKVAVKNTIGLDLSNIKGGVSAKEIVDAEWRKLMEKGGKSPIYEFFVGLSNGDNVVPPLNLRKIQVLPGECEFFLVIEEDEVHRMSLHYAFAKLSVWFMSTSKLGVVQSVLVYLADTGLSAVDVASSVRNLIEMENGDHIEVVNGRDEHAFLTYWREKLRKKDIEDLVEKVLSQL